LLLDPPQFGSSLLKSVSMIPGQLCHVVNQNIRQVARDHLKEFGGSVDVLRLRDAAIDLGPSLSTLKSSISVLS